MEYLVGKLVRNMKYDILNNISRGENLLYKVISRLWYCHFFKKFGKNSKIVRPLSMRGTRNIIIEDNITINKYVHLVTETGDKEYMTPRLIIRSGTTIGNFNHIVCTDEIYIGHHVLTGDRVYITDNYHKYDNLEMPISRQGISSKGKTVIGDETWIGENVCVISAKIGKHCVIGSNSVVTRNIPDYCIAVGAPARVIKKFDINKQKWVKVYEETGKY